MCHAQVSDTNQREEPKNFSPFLLSPSFHLLGEAIDFINKGNSAEMVREEVQHCINNNDKEAAKALVSKFNLKTI